MGEEERSAHSFPKSSSLSMVLMRSIYSNRARTSKSETSSPIFLYILSAAISETKSLISISCLKCVCLLKEIQSPTKVCNSSVNSHIPCSQPVNESRNYLSFYMNISIENKTHRGADKNSGCNIFFSKHSISSLHYGICVHQLKT